MSAGGLFRWALIEVQRLDEGGNVIKLIFFRYSPTINRRVNTFVSRSRYVDAQFPGGSFRMTLWLGLDCCKNSALDGCYKINMKASLELMGEVS